MAINRGALICLTVIHGRSMPISASALDLAASAALARMVRADEAKPTAVSDIPDDDVRPNPPVLKPTTRPTDRPILNYRRVRPVELGLSISGSDTFPLSEDRGVYA